MPASTLICLQPRTLAYSIALSTPVLYINKEAFRKAGLDPEKPPKTWAEMEDAAKKLVSLGDGVVGYGMPLGKEEAQVESSL